MHHEVRAKVERALEDWRRPGVVHDTAGSRAVRDVAEVRYILDTLRANRVPFTINTDGPDMLMTTILKEYQFLLQQGIFTDEDVVRCNQTALDASFLNRTCPV